MSKINYKIATSGEKLSPTATVDEIIDWAIKEFHRADNLPQPESDFIKKATMLILNKRIPNPEVCYSCGQKIVKGKI